MINRLAASLAGQHGVNQRWWSSVVVGGGNCHFPNTVKGLDDWMNEWTRASSNEWMCVDSTAVSLSLNQNRPSKKSWETHALICLLSRKNKFDINNMDDNHHHRRRLFAQSSFEVLILCSFSLFFYQFWRWQSKNRNGLHLTLRARLGSLHIYF